MSKHPFPASRFTDPTEMASSGETLRTPSGRQTPAIAPEGTATVAALALGLAYSHLSRDQTVDELVATADAEVLVRARRRLDAFPHHEPEIVTRAKDLLDAALAARLHDTART